MSASVERMSRDACRRFDAAVTCIALGSLAVSLLAMLGEWSWRLELLSHFRVQYLAAQLAVLAALGVRRRWRFAALILPVLAVNAHATLPYWPATGTALAAGTGFKIMTANVHVANTEYPRLLELARRENPDVLLLLEVDHEWIGALAPLAERYAYTVTQPREDAFGIALLSRLPIERHRVVDLLGAPALDARIATAGGPLVRIIGVHLEPPVSARRAGTRNRQLAALARLAENDAGPLIIAGDFNVTPYSPVFADWLARSGLRDARARRGLSLSWPTFLPLLGIPIDHCLIGGPLAVAQHYRGPSFGSDHYPILTQLIIEGSLP